MGETSSGQTALIREVVPGVTPAAPAFSVIDFTSEDLVMTKTKVRSAAVTPQRVARSSRTAGREVGGGISFELYKAPEVDMLLESLMGNAWAANVSKLGGNVIHTYSVERKLSDTDYRRFVGWRPGTIEFTIAPEAVIGTRVVGVGYSEVSAAAAIAGAVYTPAGVGEKLTALDIANVTLSGGLALALDYEAINFTINNQLTARKRVGPNSTRRISAGQALVTGQFRAYVEDKSLFDAYQAETKFDMDIPMIYGGAGYTAGLRDIDITGYNDPNTGNNNEFVAVVDFEATLDAAFGSSFSFTKTA